MRKRGIAAGIIGAIVLGFLGLEPAAGQTRLTATVTYTRNLAEEREAANEDYRYDSLLAQYDKNRRNEDLRHRRALDTINKNPRITDKKSAIAKENDQHTVSVNQIRRAIELAQKDHEQRLAAIRQKYAKAQPQPQPPGNPAPPQADPLQKDRLLAAEDNRYDRTVASLNDNFRREESQNAQTLQTIQSNDRIPADEKPVRMADENERHGVQLKFLQAQATLAQDEHAQRVAEINARSGGAGPQRGALGPALDSFNRFVDSVPGLSGALQSGAEITAKIKEELHNEYDLTKSPDAGLRLIRDALTAEGGELLRILSKTPLSAGVREVAALVGKQPSVVEQNLGKLVAESERIEDEAVRQAAAIGEKWLKKYTDLQAIANLKDQVRGANARINKILYRLYQAEKGGADPSKVLSAALDANNYAGQAKQLTLRNLLDNYNGAKSVGAFSPDNLKRLRVGKTAVLDVNGVKLDIDHIVPAAVTQEVATLLANLRITAASVNRTAQATVTGRALDYAEALNEAKLLSDDGLKAVRNAFASGVYK
jgi:hypothetical protein